LDDQALDEQTESGREACCRNGSGRVGGIAGVFAFVRGLRWPWKFAIGAALTVPWAAFRIAAFGFSPELPYIAFYPAVAMAAALGGSVAGVGAALLSILAEVRRFAAAATIFAVA
jgi:hypothetical protein